MGHDWVFLSYLSPFYERHDLRPHHHHHHHHHVLVVWWVPITPPPPPPPSLSSSSSSKDKREWVCWLFDGSPGPHSESCNQPHPITPPCPASLRTLSFQILKKMFEQNRSIVQEKNRELPQLLKYLLIYGDGRPFGCFSSVQIDTVKQRSASSPKNVWN